MMNFTEAMDQFETDAIERSNENTVQVIQTIIECFEKLEEARPPKMRDYRFAYDLAFDVFNFCADMIDRGLMLPADVNSTLEFIIESIIGWNKQD